MKRSKKIFFQGEIDLSEFGRFKFWTDGTRNLVFMGIENCTKADEGVYRCLITNRFGRREHKFKLFISSELMCNFLSKFVSLVLQDLLGKRVLLKER